MEIYQSDLNDPKLGYVEEIDARLANASEDNRIEFVSKTASVSRGKDSFNNPVGRYKTLLKEGALNTPSRCLEFIPIVLRARVNEHSVALFSLDSYSNIAALPLEDFLNKLAKYSYLEYEENHFKIYTNLRALLKAGISYGASTMLYSYSQEYKNFKVFKMSIPMFVFNHLVTHTQLSKETRSDRVTKLDDTNYWLPADLASRAKEYNKDTSKIEDMFLATEVDDFLTFLKKQCEVRPNYNEIVHFLLNTPQLVVAQALRVLGYPKEIYQRAMLEFRYKETVVAGWVNNPATWEHFLLERGGSDKWKNWVQPETKMLAMKIQNILNG